MSDVPTIWVVNEAGHSTQAALETVPGAVIQPLTLGNVSPLRVDRILFHLSQGIVKYGKAEDYLLLSGYQMINVLACMLWMTYFGKVKMLQWNAKSRRYELTVKTLDDLKDLLQKELERA